MARRVVEVFFDLEAERSVVTTVVFVVLGEVFCVVVVVLSWARTDMVDITIMAAMVAWSCFVMEPLENSAGTIPGKVARAARGLHVACSVLYAMLPDVCECLKNSSRSSPSG